MPGRSMMATSRLSGRAAMPVCCSTVTPGKLATLWRRPVSLLKRVVLPQLGGPTRATVRIFFAGGGRTAAAQPVQADILPRVDEHGEVAGGFGAEGDFRTIHLEDARVAA